MKNKILFFLISSFLFACSSPSDVKVDLASPPADTNEPAPPPPPQVLPPNNFSSICLKINISNINKLIHTEKGLWLIQSNGAMPAITNTTQVDKNFPVNFLSLKEEELPKVNCDSKYFWTKEGCFLQQINTFKDEKIWAAGDGLSKNDKDMFEERAKLIQYTVINTAFNARYYFGQIDGMWYLLFADLRKPCQA